MSQYIYLFRSIRYNSDINMNIKKASEKLLRTPTMDVCTYKRLKMNLPSIKKTPPIKLYNILEIKMVQINECN